MTGGRSPSPQPKKNAIKTPDTTLIRGEEGADSHIGLPTHNIPAEREIVAATQNTGPRKKKKLEKTQEEEGSGV